MKYMVKHPTDTTHLLAKEIPIDKTSQFKRSKYSIVDQRNWLRTCNVAFHNVWQMRDLRIRELSDLMGLAEVSTFVLMRAKGTGQVRQKHWRMLLAKELLENPWIMVELETERQQALRLRPLIVAMGDLVGGSAHRVVALEEVMRTSGEYMEAKKVMQQRCVMCGNKALAAYQVCHKPSKGVVAYLCGSYTGRDCLAQQMARVPSPRCRRF
eukprot:scaffold644_cov357-Pavlova_lutheri.AAC.3